MTGYQRQMGWILSTLDMDNSEGDRRLLDLAIKRSLSLPSDTPEEEVQSRLEAMTVEERFDLIDDLQRQLLVTTR